MMQGSFKPTPLWIKVREPLSHVLASLTARLGGLFVFLDFVDEGK